MIIERALYLFLGYLIFTFLVELPCAQAQSGRFRHHVLVVFNNANTDSETLARYYAQQRKIPDEYILGVRAPDKEEITRQEFDDQIRDPIDAYLVNKGWITRQPGHSPFGDQQQPVMAAKINEIYIIVLVYGMPLKVAEDPKITDAPVTNAALGTNASSVDSDLALLPYQGLPITGYLPNPYRLIFYDRPFDGLDAKQMIMVTRLDGPSPGDVRKIIDDAIYAEKTRLVGNVYLDAQGITDKAQGYFEGDEWLRKSSEMFVKNGFHTEIDDTPELFPNNLPWTNVALYAGWYTGQAAGPFMRESRTFSRGAIGYHIHSFGASTLRSPTANWCGPLIEKGVAATMGAVYEPYLDLMPHWDDFVDRLLHGYTFAEAAYASTKALSWMTVFVGDPLYTPFRLPIDEALENTGDKPSVRKDLLMIQQARAALVKGDVQEAKVDAEKAIADQNATFVAWEGYAEIMSDPRSEPPNSTVAEAYEHAFNLSVTVEDQVRTAFECSKAYLDRFRPQDAKRVLSLLMSHYPNESVYYGIEAKLKQIQNLAPVSIPPAISNAGLKPTIDSLSLPP